MSEFTIGTGVTARLFRPSTARVTVLPTGTPLDGADGTDGVDGKSMLHGTGAPASDTGTNGDFYIDVTYPPTLYGPKASGVWPSGTSLVGPAGSSAAPGGHNFLTMGG